MAKVRPQTVPVKRPPTPDPRDVVCPHQHFKYDIIDRDILSRKQHLNLLCTPKGYRWVMMKGGAADDAKDHDDIKYHPCRVVKKKPGKTYVHNILAELWSLLTPEMIARLKEMLMAEFGLTEEAAVDFICHSRQDTMQMAHRVKTKRGGDGEGLEGEDGMPPEDPTLPRVIAGPKFCDKSQFAVGIDPCDIKEFSRIVSTKFSEYVVAMMCARRNNRHRRFAEVVLNGLCELTGEKTTLDNPKNRLHKILTVTSDRVALWLAQNMDDDDNKRNKRRKKEDEALKKNILRKQKEQERRRKEKEKMNKEIERNKKRKAQEDAEMEKQKQEDEEKKKNEKEKRRQELEKFRHEDKKKKEEEQKKTKEDEENKKQEKKEKQEQNKKKLAVAKSASAKSAKKDDQKPTGKDQKSATAGGNQRSRTAGKDQRSATADRDQKSAATGRDQKPDQKPGAGGRDQKPATAGRPTGRDEKPSGGDQANPQSRAQGGRTDEDTGTKGSEHGGATSGEEGAGPSSREGGAGSTGGRPGSPVDDADTATASTPAGTVAPGPGGSEATSEATSEDQRESEGAVAESEGGGVSEGQTEPAPTPTQKPSDIVTQEPGGPGKAPEGPTTSGDGQPGSQPVTDQPSRQPISTKAGAGAADDESKSKLSTTAKQPGEQIGQPPGAPGSEPIGAAGADRAPTAAEGQPGEPRSDQLAAGGSERKPYPEDRVIAVTASQIVSTKPIATPRQETLQDILSKELEKRLEPKDKETEEIIREVASKTASWIDQNVKDAEIEYGSRDTLGISPVSQKPKGPLFVVKQIDPMRSTYDVRQATHTEAGQKIRALRRKASGRTVTSDPSGPSDPKMWAKWAVNASQMAEDWGHWIDKTIQDAEDKAVQYQTKAKDGITDPEDEEDWNRFVETTNEDALSWRRKKKSLDEAAKEWKMNAK